MVSEIASIPALKQAYKCQTPGHQCRVAIDGSQTVADACQTTTGLCQTAAAAAANPGCRENKGEAGSVMTLSLQCVTYALKFG